MTVLGISEEHDAGVALIKDGTIYAATNEERYSGKKFHYGFPHKSLHWIYKKLPNLQRTVDLAIASNFHVAESFGNWQDMPWYFRLIEFSLSVTRLDCLIWGTRIGPNLLNYASKITNLFRKQQICRQITKVGFTIKHCSFVDHHLCHAASAYYTSGWDSCLVITIDASGDGYCSKVFTSHNTQLSEVHAIPFFHSPGHYYEYVTLMFGFKIGREGKVTGLAALGNPNKTYPIFAKLLTYNQVEHRFDNHGLYRNAALQDLKQKLNQFSREDIAAGVQKLLETVVCAYINDMISLYAENKPINLAVAGGIFANVKLNQKIAELKKVKSLYIFPHMGDGGLAAGAALYADRQVKTPQASLTHVYLGHKITEMEINQAITKFGPDIHVYSPRNLTLKVAQLLAKGHVVAIVQNEMEYGPRALGHRSILYQATDPTVNDWLNHRLNRSEFMPFAPIIKKDDLALYFKGVKKVMKPLEYMTVTLTCNQKCKQEAPAIVHKDNTARPQTITQEKQPFINQVLTHYSQITGLKILINTSFNMHESPIVRTAEDAIQTFLKGNIDYLVLNDQLITCHHNHHEN